MAETTSNTAPSAAPAITQGQTTSVGENTQTILEAEATPVQQEQSFFANPLLWIVAALWLWFLFGNKKRKAQRTQEKKDRERREAMQKGDEVVTIGRMHGTVVALTDQTVTIKPDKKSDYTMTFDRQAIFRVLPRAGEEDADDASAAK